MSNEPNRRNTNNKPKMSKSQLYGQIALVILMISAIVVMAFIVT
jgi:hypothetical protein